MNTNVPIVPMNFDRSLDGQLFDLDQQCVLKLGIGSYSCGGNPDVCEALYCAVPNGDYCIGISGIGAMDGSSPCLFDSSKVNSICSG